MKRGSAKGGLAWRCSAAAALVFAALGGRTPVAAQSVQPFSPPQSSLLVSRTLVRSLPDGKTITTRRSYEVRIFREGAGFRVEGELVEVSVDAPPSLRVLADLERQRPDNGPFPVHLDARGMIASESGPLASPLVERAATFVGERIGSSGLPAPDKEEAQAFVASLRGGAAHSAWPDDVFHPAIGKRSETRTIALPGGGEGQVIVEVEGQAAGPGGQIAVVDRIVTTDLGGDRRVTREHWQINRHAANSER